MSPSPRPDVSVVIPTHNRRSLLPTAVASCLDGNEAVDVEVIVVDDGSTDGTRAWMESLDDNRVEYVRQENQGAPVARNRGMETATGRYLKFLDDDDRLAEGRLVDEVRVLDETGADVCCGNLQARKEDGNSFVFETDPSPDLAAGIFSGRVVTYPLIFLYRYEAISDVDWDPSLPYHQDTDFAVRVASTGASVASLDRIVGIWNDHDGDRIKTTIKAETCFQELIRQRIEVIEKGLARLRARGAVEAYHREAAAQGIWTWAHMVAASDLQSFRKCFRTIRTLDEQFMPSRSSSVLESMDRILGPSATEHALFPLRWFNQRLPL